MVGWCVLCLGVAQALEHETVARWELATDGSALMSCADEPSSSNEPLWCANHDAPHCTRGAPAPSGNEPWLGPVLALHMHTESPALRAEPRPAAAPRPVLGVGHADAARERLERPPRRA